MKKIVLKGMAVLCASAAFIACSHDSVFDENIVQDNLKNEYRASFEKKYGKIDPNQSWDFTEPFVVGDAARTRIVPANDREPQSTYTTESGIVVKQYSLSSVLGETVINSHKSKIQKKLKGQDGGYIEKHWDTDMNVFSIWACFVTAPTDRTYNRVMKIGVHSVGLDGNTYNTCILNNGSGYEAIRGYAMNTAYAGAFYTIDVTGMKASSSDYYWYCVSTPSTTDDPTASNDVLNDEAKLDLFREVNVNGTTYWCFDSNHDKTYTGLICQVSPILYGKRYMIEDLGSIGDFDFNDIVVDVYETYDGQMAAIRALGGTLNFTLTIGNTDCTWTKEGSKVTVKVNNNTVEEDTEVTKMYNTLNPDYDLVLAEFPVSGWIPGDNNISVKVTKKGTTTNNSVYTIKFPKKGDAPMIIAVDPVRRWMNEYTSVPTDWWYDLANQQ